MKCLNCQKTLIGRADKKYCDVYCKSAIQYKNALIHPATRFQWVQNQLKLNRRILKKYNKAGKVVIRKSLLVEEGFNPQYFTNYWKNQKGDIYWFVFEYGFLIKKEKEIEKYVLILWQDNMAKRQY
ncbi:MAG: hypothetical protein ACPGSD_01690 [Flavobacteriales bacterium]